MKFSTLPRYLFGGRKAILEIAASRWSILIAAIFVLSAGFAREYDGEDLIHEPWHALRPLGASLGTGTVLFLLVHGAAMFQRERGEGSPPPFLKGYRSFLALFWMTAPMAWLYAIPYERFMSPVGAIECNLWTLAFVAAWRVVLMTRVIGVIYGVGSVTSFFLVMLFADAVLIAVLWLVPTPVIDVMGGLRHSERDAFVAGITFSITILAVLTAPVWVLGALISACLLKPRWPELRLPDSVGRSRGLLLTAVLSLVAFSLLLIVGQPEQVNRRRAERLLRGGHIGEAFALMSARRSSDYPPHWEPPPRLGYRERTPDLADVQAAMSDQWPAQWVADRYLPKISRKLHDDLLPWRGTASWTDIIEYLEENDSIDGIKRAEAETAAFLLEHDDGLTDSDRAALLTFARLFVKE